MPKFKKNVEKQVLYKARKHVSNANKPSMTRTWSSLATRRCTSTIFVSSESSPLVLVSVSMPKSERFSNATTIARTLRRKILLCIVRLSGAHGRRSTALITLVAVGRRSGAAKSRLRILKFSRSICLAFTRLSFATCALTTSSVYFTISPFLLVVLSMRCILQATSRRRRRSVSKVIR